jgi:voltage-gated potassium channel
LSHRRSGQRDRVTENPRDPGEQERLRWERAADWPLTAAALAFLVGWSWPILDPQLAPGWRHFCWAITWLAWAVFAVDYVVRLVLADDRRRFVRRHLLDLAVVVLPILRPLRLLRLITLLTVLNRRAGSSLRGRVATYVVGATTLVTYVASVAMLSAERGHPGANIQTFGDSVWWALVTMSTVGYGEQFPVTTTGRVIGAGLMMCGVALLGVVTATLASWLVDRVSDIGEDQQAATRRDIVALREEIRALRAQLDDEDRRAG